MPYADERGAGLKSARIPLPAFDELARAADIFVEEMQAAVLGTQGAAGGDGRSGAPRATARPLSHAGVSMRLQEGASALLPRVVLGQFPTPLDQAPRLAPPSAVRRLDQARGS